MAKKKKNAFELLFSMSKKNLRDKNIYLEIRDRTVQLLEFAELVAEKEQYYNATIEETEFIFVMLFDNLMQIIYEWKVPDVCKLFAVGEIKRRMDNMNNIMYVPQKYEVIYWSKIADIIVPFLNY